MEGDARSIRYAVLTAALCAASQLTPAQVAPGQETRSLNQPSAGPISNQPASIGASFDWPPQAAMATTTDPISSSGGAPSSGRQGGQPVEPKTPIRRTQAAPDDASADPPNAKPKPADMLRTGAWNSGVAVVLLAILGVTVVSVLRKRHPQLTAGLPREVCDVLGRKRIDPRTNICLVRVGQRILVLGATAESVTPLAEITDPVEIDQLAGLCKLTDQPGLPSFSGLMKQKRIRPSDREVRNEEQRKRSRDRSQEPADLPGLRDRRAGQKLDVTTP